MTLPALTFECYQLESGVWCKRRANGLRGACVADEAILWQHLQAALADLEARCGKPTPSLDLAGLVKENEQLTLDCERLTSENERLHLQYGVLVRDNEQLRANQRQKPGRKPRGSNAAGAEDQALAAPEQEQEPLDEDL